MILDEEGGEAGALAIVDYKVATDEAREARHHEQLRVYSLGGRGEGLTVEAAYVHDLRAGTRTATDISAEASARALGAVTARLAALRAGRFDPKPEARRCSACEYARICRHRATDVAPQLN